MDCVLYGSARTVLEALGDRVVTGTVIVVDEYFNDLGWRGTGEYEAFREFVERRGIAFEYLAHCYASTPVAVRIL